MRGLIKMSCGCLLAAMILACVTARGGVKDGLMDWSKLHNPVLEYPNWSVKDYGVAYNNGACYIFYSAFYEEEGRVRSHVAAVKTSDFKTYSEPLFNLWGKEDGWTGMCSPNVSKIGGKWVMTFNSWGDIHPNGQTNQLFYRESADLETWGPIKPIAANLTTGKRAIDIAIEQANGKIYLIFKEKQTPKIAVGDSLDGDFKFIGDGLVKFKMTDGNTANAHENYQFLKIDGKWHLLVTNMKGAHGPHLYTMAGDGATDEDWLQWVDGYKCMVADEPFNTGSHDNSSVLLDQSAVDGYYYLLYAGSMAETKEQYAGRSHNKLGLSRSTDLKTWLPAGKL